MLTLEWRTVLFDDCESGTSVLRSIVARDFSMADSFVRRLRGCYYGSEVDSDQVGNYELINAY